MAEWIAAKLGIMAGTKAAQVAGNIAKETLPLFDVIEWSDYTNKEKDVVWKHPARAVKWGSTLIVKQYEAAAFYRDGKMYEVFGPGRHVLTTANLPLLTSFFKNVYSEPAFTANVFFVSTREFTGLFGGRSQTRELFPLLANGQFWYKITDPTLFVNEVVGGNKRFTTDEVSEFLRGFLNQNIIKELATYDLETAFTKALDNTSIKTKTAIFDKLERFGIDLFDLKFNSIDTEDRYRELAAMVKQGVSASEVLRMFTLRESAKELGKSTGGASLGAGFVLPQMLSQMPPQVQQNEKQDSLELLKIRYAKGEIDKKEYEEKKKVLEQ